MSQFNILNPIITITEDDTICTLSYSYYTTDTNTPATTTYSEGFFLNLGFNLHQVKSICVDATGLPYVNNPAISQGYVFVGDETATIYGATRAVASAGDCIVKDFVRPTANLLVAVSNKSANLTTSYITVSLHYKRLSSVVTTWRLVQTA